MCLEAQRPGLTNFTVHRLPHAWTPLHLARHRSDAWKRQQKLVTRGT